MTLLLGQALTTPIASRKTTAAEGLSPKDTHRREIWTGQEWLPSQLYQSPVGRHIGCLDSQHFPGDEPVGIVRDFYLAAEKCVVVSIQFSLYC